MLTIEGLREYGANVDEGVARCANNEMLYLKLIPKLIGDEGFDELAELILERDYEKAFEVAHRLKGAAANLSMTPIEEPITRISDSLKVKEERDYSEDLKQVRQAVQALSALQ